MRSRKGVWLLPLGGAWTALCLLIPAIGFLEWFAMAPALVYFFGKCEEKTVRARWFYLYGLFYFFAFYLGIYHWFLALYPMQFAGISKGQAAALVVFCWVGLSVLHTLFCALSFSLVAVLARTHILTRFRFLLPVLFAAVYTVFEWCMTLTFAGVPWGRLALGQISYGICVGGASLFGSYFVTFALVACNAWIAFAIVHPERIRVAVLSAAAVFLVNIAAGITGIATADVSKGTGILAAAVQGNVGTAEKWNAESTEKTLLIYETYTAQAAEAGAALVVFPETFLPYSMDEGTDFREYTRRLAVTYHVMIQCGGFTEDEDGVEYNAVFTVYPDGTVSETVYKKRHLVPFGEYVPLRGLVERVFPALADMGMMSDDLGVGTDSAITDSAWGKIGSLICFDSIYETLTLESVRDGAELITLPTNDSWFTDSAAAYMHNNQARLRAIENNRYIVRSADTGISAIITPRGKVLDAQEPMTEGMAMETVYFNSGRTLYSYVGNLFVYLLWAGLAFLSGAGIFESGRERKRRICASKKI